MVAVDFFVVPTLTFRLLFAFVVLRHHRRELLHVNVTAHPTAIWTAQQIVEAFPNDTAPRLSRPRSRLDLQRHLPPPSRQPGHSPGSHRAPRAVAKSLRRACYWLHPPRMPR